MDSGSKLPKRSTEDIFAEAIARVEAGEPLETVAASYPAEVQAELRDLLQIIAVAVQIQHVPVPRPALDRREARKQAFLQTASQLRVEHTVVTPVVAPSNAGAEPTLAERLQAIWAAVQAAFTVRTMRLAPMIVVLAFICLSSFSLATFAQEALPGDIAYPMKEWIRYQKLNLSSPAQQAQVLLENERELQNDVKKVAEKVQQTPGADLNKAVVKASGTLIYHGDEGRYLIIGGLQVLKKYQPDANQNQSFNDIVIKGQLAPGKQVVLAYQILPIQSNDGDAPIVQGIALEVLEDAPVLPTPVPSNTPVPTYTAAPVSNCEVKPPPGWVPYTVQSRDTLSAFAQRTNTSVSRLILVNCLVSDAITEGSILLAPPLAPTATPFVPPTPLPTVTPVDTATAIETITAGGTITPVATIDATATAVFTTTEPAIELTLTAIASTPTPTTTPTASAVATEATAEPTTTPTTPSTPDATTAPTATDLATATPTEGTATASVTPTALTTESPSATPEPGLTPASADTPTSVSNSNTPAAATETAVMVPTQTAVPAATQVALPTATSTPLPPPTTAASTEGNATKSGAQPTSVQRPTAVIFTATPIGVSPLR